MEIRTASIEELDAVNQQVEEFAQPYPLSAFRERLTDRPWLGLVAEEAGQLLGFKVGYELEPGVFYSWLGGVLPQARGKGVARTLLHEQETWLREHNYHEVRVKSRNRFRAMVTLLLSEEYLVTGFTQDADPMDNRIHFSKKL